MVLKKAHFLDADYIVRNNLTYVRLLVRGKKTTYLYYRHDPHFYVDAGEERIRDIEKITAQRKMGGIAKVLRVEKCERAVAGKKKQVLKVFCHEPGDVPIIKNAMPFPCYEYNILFGRRFMLDMQLSPFSVIHYEREGRIIKKINKISKIEAGAMPKLTTLAFDIETYNPSGISREKKDPVLMISYAGAHNAVLTYKKPALEKDFLVVLKDEKEMVAKFCEAVAKENPDIIYGYNSSVFDLPYLQARADMYGIKLHLGRGKTGMRKIRKGMVSGMRISGRIHVDLYPMMRFFGFIGLIKTSDYTLEKVYEAAIGKKKFMVSRKDIWQMWDKNELDELADYSLKDSLITKELGDYYIHLQVELSSITKMPLFDTVLSTSGQLVENVLMFQSAADNMVIPSRPGDAAIKERMLSPIQGAFVKLPAPGIYENIAVMDFRGLYPSIIASYNIDPYTTVEDEKIPHHKAPSGTMFAQSPQGLIPKVVSWLLDYRLAIKKEMKKHPKDTSEYRQLDARSWALKIVTNSIYGYLAYPRSRWYSREAGEATTAYGRKHIQDTIEKAERSGFQVLYGDSITSERFVTLLDSEGRIRIQNVEELFNRYSENVFVLGEKEIVKPNGYFALTLNPKTFEPQWKKVNEVIRHKTNKKIYRVSQKYGETRVTEDHSLIVKRNGSLTVAKPHEMLNTPFTTVRSIPPLKEIFQLDIYDYLKHYSYEKLYKGRKKIIKAWADEKYVWFNWTNRKNPVKLKRLIATGSPEFASLCRLLGAYIPEGASSTPETTSSRWGATISTSDKNWLIELKKDHDNLFVGASASIIPSMKKIRELDYKVGNDNRHVTYADKTHKLQMMNKLSAAVFKAFCGQRSNGKKLPDFIYHVPDTYKIMLLEQMIKGDGSRRADDRYSKAYRSKNFRYTTKSLELASGMSLLLSQLKVNYFITYRTAKPVYTLGTSEMPNKRLETKLIEEKYSGYVYDLSVEDNHMFTDSCGQVLLHNTDSLFILHRTKQEVLDFITEVNKSLPEKMELELEGFYPRGVFVGKKTHGGEEKGAKKKYALLGEDARIKIRGFELVRRDWSEIAKETQRQVLEAILREGSKEKAVDIVRKTVERLRKGDVKMDELAIETQLNKDAGSYEVKSPELGAAEKGKARGIPMDKGTIISFIITRKGKTISEKAELAEFAKDYDVDYYVDHQVLPAVMKILKELGYDEHSFKVGGKQKGLSDFI